MILCVLLLLIDNIKTNIQPPQFISISSKFNSLTTNGTDNNNNNNK